MTSGKTVRDLYARGSSRIRRTFERSGDGTAAVCERAALVDTVTLRLWEDSADADTGGPPGFCLIARGGYGRARLFPHSDVDLLFLFENEVTQRKRKDVVGEICQRLWDLGIRVGPTARTLPGCARFEAANLEFLPSLIDCRYVAGDYELFRRLHEETLPQVLHREWQGTVQQLLELTQTRHQKYGRTIFHLEPNIKECPGGLRDFDVGCWLRLLAGFDRQAKWPDESERAGNDCSDAVAFLTTVRCFLHYHHGRDDNVMSWQDQDAIAAKSVGTDGGAVDAAGWMRQYFRSARQIARWTEQLLDEVPPARSSVYQQFLRWRSRLSNADFSVVGGRVYLQQSSSAADADILLRLFEFVALHGLKLARDTESRIQQSLGITAANTPKGAALWAHVREILRAPHAAQALRELNALGILKTIIPEFSSVDALVVRDYYHRYTVDEHTFLAIETLKSLKREHPEGDPRYAELLNEVEEPELLFLALLLHDAGKAQEGVPHIESSARLAEQCTARFQLSSAQADAVHFLVANHLEMSAAMRRDIFDSETIRVLSAKVNSPDWLKMLCLMTYADIRAVNPEAMTAWKADNLWHLYVGTLNHLNRTADEDPQTTGLDDPMFRKIAELVPGQERELEKFLGGLPRRYAHTHPSEEIVEHFGMALRLREDPVQLSLEFHHDFFELSVVTRERAGLFAGIAGALTAWGIDIIKAAAFSNASGVVVDTLICRDRFKNLELNPPERERFQQSVKEVLTGHADLQERIQNRIHVGKFLPVKKIIEPRVVFDNESSSHSTIVEIIAQDRPGLLYRIASVFTELACNIEIALIETEGPMAIDVFYITRNQRKLNAETQSSIYAILTASETTSV